MVMEATTKNFEELTNKDTPTVVDFWAPWCMPCQMMGPVFEELSKELEGKINFIKVNVDEEQNIAGQYGVQSIPTLVVMKNGKEINRVVGFLPKPVLKKQIEELIA